jgi:hypothetical protein
MKDRFNDARRNLYPHEMMDVDTRSHGDRRLDVSSTPATRVGYWCLHLARAKTETIAVSRIAHRVEGSLDVVSDG